MKNILVCDDDKEIVESIATYLKTENYNVVECNDGNSAINTIRSNNIDLLLLDLVMPEMDGYQTISLIRKESNIPIIVLSSKNDDNDKIEAYKVGADDYIEKPFNPLILLAKCDILLKRNYTNGSKMKTNCYINYEIMVNDNDKTVTKNNTPIKLTPIEYNILLLFIKNKGKTYTQEEIYQEIWHTKCNNNSINTLTVHIRNLREKIEDDTKNPRHIKVIWGVGYTMEKN